MPLPPATPFTAQVTAPLDTPETEALNCILSPTCRLSEAGDTTTLATTCSFCVSDLVGSAWLTAVIVILGLGGRVEGGVYSPSALIVPEVELPPVIPLTCQFTAEFEVRKTCAVNCCVRPMAIKPLRGNTVTKIRLAAA